MKTSLLLAPLPSSRHAAESPALRMEREGFVDESVVTALVDSPLRQRSSGNPADLALAADDMDFAGWNLPAFRGQPLLEPSPPVVHEPIRRPAPPLPAAVAALPTPQPTHRWWLAAAAGLISTLAVSAGLLAFALRGEDVAKAFQPAGAIAPPHGAPPTPQPR